MFNLCICRLSNHRGQHSFTWENLMAPLINMRQSFFEPPKHLYLFVWFYARFFRCDPCVFCMMLLSFLPRSLYWRQFLTLLISSRFTNDHHIFAQVLSFLRSLGVLSARRRLRRLWLHWVLVFCYPSKCIRQLCSIYSIGHGPAHWPLYFFHRFP